MTEIYVVHSHMHELGNSSGGGGFDSFQVDQEAEAREAYAKEVALADRCELLEVNLYKAQAPDGLTPNELDEWVFDNFEVGTPPVTPIQSFLKGEYPDGGC
jgi:hypothetical protein